MPNIIQIQIQKQKQIQIQIQIQIQTVAYIGEGEGEEGQTSAPAQKYLVPVLDLGLNCHGYSARATPSSHCYSTTEYSFKNLMLSKFFSPKV